MKKQKIWSKPTGGLCGSEFIDERSDESTAERLTERESRSWCHQEIISKELFMQYNCIHPVCVCVCVCCEWEGEGGSQGQITVT